MPSGSDICPEPLYPTHPITRILDTMADTPKDPEEKPKRHITMTLESGKYEATLGGKVKAEDDK